jgi:hypothetical protein
MSIEPAKPAHFSQFETSQPRIRVVLLGASNLSMCLPRVVTSARAALRAPLECFVATGFGRSYGQESKFFWKKFPGILQSDLWPVLDRAAPLPTLAILADVGNDLGYGAAPEQVLEWVATTIDRLVARGARIALNNLPLASLQSVGALRYRVMKSALFPSCRLSRDELLRRAEALHASLAELAAMRQIPVFSAANSWYGIDPIHPRRRHAGAIWQRLIAALADDAGDVEWVAPPRGDARLIRRARSAAWSRRAVRDAVHPPRAYLDDGSSIALF